jgi:hypothetical protein
MQAVRISTSQDKAKAVLSAALNSTAIVGACLALALGAPANAQPVSGLAQLTGSIEQDQHALGDAREKQDELKTANEKDMKVYDSYATSEKGVEAQEEQLAAPMAADLKRREDSANGIVDNYNGECAANRVGPLQPGPYQRCVSLKAQVSATVSAIRAQIQTDRQNFLNEKIAPLERIRAQQTAAMNQIAERMKLRFADWQKWKDTADALQHRIDENRAALVAACAGADARAATNPGDSSALEAMHYCHSIGWDGASRTLPPLGTPHRPFAVTPNG